MSVWLHLQATPVVYFAFMASPSHRIPNLREGGFSTLSVNFRYFRLLALKLQIYQQKECTFVHMDKGKNQLQNIWNRGWKVKSFFLKKNCS